jgi:hypothetical protein
MEPTRYQIRVRDQIDSRWSRWFEDFSITLNSAGETILCGVVADQAALYGALNRIRDLGLELIAVQPLDNAQEEHER